MSDRMIMKKTNEDSFFRAVQTPGRNYNWQSLEIEHYDVLQVMPLNERFIIVEYGKYKEELEK